MACPDQPSAVDHRHDQAGQHQENAARHVYDTEQDSEQFYRQWEDDGIALVADNRIKGRR